MGARRSSRESTLTTPSRRRPGPRRRARSQERERADETWASAASALATAPDDGQQPAKVAHKPRRRRAGHWLPDDMRRSLGAELLAALEEDEPVELVTSAATWASPQAVLAVTDRRLLWLLDDAISHRVRSLAFKAITAVEVKRRRRSASVRVSRRRGRPIEFAELPAATAAAIARLSSAC